MGPLGIPIKPTTYAKINLPVAGFVNLPNPISISHIPGLLIIPQNSPIICRVY